jgi:hypothetical protein
MAPSELTEPWLHDASEKVTDERVPICPMAAAFAIARLEHFRVT